MESNSTLKERIDTAFFQIIGMDPAQRRDLQKMWRQCRSKWAEMDIELIQCRKQNKHTVRYKDLEAQLLERLEMVEKYLLFAVLTKIGN